MLVHQGEGEMKFLIPSYQSPVTTNQLYIHLAEDDLLSGYPESRSFLFYRQTQIGGTTWMRRLWKMEYCYSTLGFCQLCKRI